MAFISAVDLLYENTNITASYGAKTISTFEEGRSPGDYDGVIIFYNSNATAGTDGRRGNSIYVPIGEDGNLFRFVSTSETQNARPVTVNASSIYFGACHAGSSTTSNGSCIPAAVYGVKF